MLLRRLSLLPIILSAGIAADEKPAAVEMNAAGHSMQGDAFNEGPRQFAKLMPGLVNVHFPVTTKNAEAQKFIDQGVCQLHGFWYFEAERSFRQAAWLDPDCAIAYWGMMMANVNTEKRAMEFIKEATKRRLKAGPREQQWIDMWAAYYADTKKDEKDRRKALVKAYEELIYSFPDDLEAKAFLVLQLWDNQMHGLPNPSALAVEALAKQVLEKQPMHPGIHHYLIHLWNRGGGDKHAVTDAARCGQSSPAIAHLWHMSGHTFSELRRYSDAAWQQEASARVDHAYMAAARIMPEQIHNYAHNNDWLVKNLGYLGRVHDGMELARNLVELPRMAPTKDAAWKMGRNRLQELGVTFELWDELLALEKSGYLDKDPDPAREAERLRAMGLAAFSKGNEGDGDARLATLEKMLSELRTERIAAADRAEAEAKKANKSDEDVAKAMTTALKGFASRVSGLENSLADLRLTRALKRGDLAKVKEQLPLAKDIPSARQALIQLALGDTKKAEQLARDLIKADAGQVLPYALLAHILNQANRPEEAMKAFEQLRERSAGIDIGLPPFARLQVLAERAGLPKDWRAAKTVASDVGDRPELAKLGPFRWQPYQAPDFSLPDAGHQAVSLEERRGKPTLVVFYLGAGCSHCIQQLNTFAPLAKEYSKQGIEIVAISTDTPEGLERTFSQAKSAEGFPFKIVSDHELDYFHAYRAYDDFEGMPLHGTFLVDGKGFVRWQNISYQPFTEAKWLLEESKRLLAIPLESGAETAARK